MQKHQPLQSANEFDNRSPHIRLISIDLDGTLVHSSGTVSLRNQEALQQARQAGVEVVINTGRRHSYALRAVRPLRVPGNDVLITSNGAVVRTAAGELMWSGTLSRPLVHRLLQELRDFRDALVFTFDLVGPGGTDVAGALVLEDLDHLHGSISRWMEVNAASIQRFVPLERAFQQTDGALPIQAMLCGTMTRMHTAEHLLTENFGDDVDCYRTEYPGHDLCILDIMPKGKSKGSALQRLAAHRGFSAGQILAIGDNWNDEPMLHAAGSAVVLSNAPADLIAYAQSQGWTIGAAGDEDGVAQAIEAALSTEAALGNEAALSGR